MSELLVRDVAFVYCITQQFLLLLQVVLNRTTYIHLTHESFCTINCES
jgi:hypothetical protein